jgi:hypothetical protein
MQVLKLQAEHVMAGIVRQLTDHVQKSPQIITDLLRCVFTEAPSDRKWSPCPEYLGCYVAKHRSGYLGDIDVHAVNLLTGMTVCNGHPPSHLPPSIVDHEVYQAVFPNVHFDVTATELDDQITCRTVDSVHGCFYSWCLKGSRLNVIETFDGQALELLPRVPLATSFSLNSIQQVYLLLYVMSIPCTFIVDKAYSSVTNISHSS